MRLSEIERAAFRRGFFCGIVLVAFEQIFLHSFASGMAHICRVWGWL